MNTLRFYDIPIGAIIKGTIVAIVSFIVLGTVAALWDNSYFLRMTPTSGFEISALVLQALFLGIYVAIPVRACATKLAGVGGIANFLGVACPICNKMLLVVFSADALMTYLEPARPYLAAFGVIITMTAVVVRWKNFRIAQQFSQGRSLLTKLNAP